jgi:hypothetical protein
VQGAAARAWEAVLARVGVDTGAEDATVVELLYSSVSAPSFLPSSSMLSFRFRALC